MQKDDFGASPRTAIWSYGGGVQSAGIAALIVLGRLPRPDLIVIADTDREVETTWSYMREVVEPALGQTIHVAPHSLSTVDLYGFNGDLLIPATTRQSGSIGRLPTFCSNEWKQRVVRRWLRERGVDECEVWLGISRDEVDRMKDADVAWIKHRYPLIELGLRRHDCLSLVASLGWPPPSKSRCFMCPHQNAAEWHTLTGYDTARAIALEDEIRAKDPLVFLHKSGEPLRVALAKPNDQPSLFDACDSGWCWT